MWIFSKLGFLSIVKKGGGDRPYQVRFRECLDAETVAAAIGLPIDRIVSNEGTDYAYRIKVDAEELTALMDQLAGSVDYSNFKDAIKHTPGQEHKVSALMQIWNIMFSLQMGAMMRATKGILWR